MRKILIALFLILCAQAVSAADVHQFPPSNIQKALELMREYLAGSGQKRTQLWNELMDLEPRGPVFADEALKLIAADRSKWKTYSEARASMLALVDTSVRESAPWKDFAGSPLKESIHRSAQSLLEVLPYTSRHQSGLLLFINRLDLWDSSDVPFLIRKAFASEGTSWRYFPRLVENFKDTSPESRREVLERARKRGRRELAQYALAYKTGLMEKDDVIWLLRLFMDDGDNYRRASSMHGSPISYAQAGVLGGLSDSEILDRNVKAINGLLHDVLQELHERLRAEDPLIKSAYDELRASPGWPGLRFSPEEKAAHLEFLRGLYTGQVISDCVERLKPVVKDEGK